MSRKRNTNLLISVLRGDFFVDKQNQKHIPFLLFIVFLLLVNISISFRAERLIMQTSSLEKEVYQLRLVYITTKSELMHLYKRSAVERLVSHKGLMTAVQPPFIITELNEE